MIQLRAYQKESIRLLRRSFSSGNKRIVLTLPTGAGKSVVFSELVRLSVEKGSTVIVCTHRIELFKETLKHIGRTGIPCEEIKPSKKNIYPNAKVYLSMAETLKKRLKKGLVLSPNLIIIDEAHIASFNSIIDFYPDCKVLAVTATPNGKTMHKYYQDIVSNIDIKELLELGFLSPCRPFMMQDNFDDVPIVRGEYEENALWKHYNNKKLFDGVIEQWNKLTPNKQTLVFNCNIEHTIAMTKAFRDAGIQSEAITSQTPPKERERIVEAFKSGSFPVLNNCGVLVAGFDVPSIECVIMNRATMSLSLWLQAQGRGSRPSPQTNKKEWFILDFGANHERHGLWEEERTWELKPPKKKKDGIAPIKRCKQCNAVLAVSIAICPYCQYEFEIAKEKPLAKGVMVEVKPKTPTHLTGKRIGDLSIKELYDLQVSKKYKPTFIWRVLRGYGIDGLKEFAKLAKYKDGWVKSQMIKIDDSEFTNFLLK